MTEQDTSLDYVMHDPAVIDTMEQLRIAEAAMHDAAQAHAQAVFAALARHREEVASE